MKLSDILMKLNLYPEDFVDALVGVSDAAEALLVELGEEVDTDQSVRALMIALANLGIARSHIQIRNATPGFPYDYEHLKRQIDLLDRRTNETKP